MVNQTIELQHGASKKLWQMDKVSNSPFEPVSGRFASTPVSHPEETERISSSEKYLRNRECQATLEGRPRAKRSPHGTTGYSTKDRGEVTVMSCDWEIDMIIQADVSAILARKNQISAAKSSNWVTLERSRLVQQRTLAQRRLDHHEVAELDAKLAEFVAQYGEELSSPQKNSRREENDTLAKLSEKNRKANAEAVRKAEIAAVEQRRRERKRVLAGKSGTATPTDPSARLKIVPRTFNSATPVSRFVVLILSYFYEPFLSLGLRLPAGSNLCQRLRRERLRRLLLQQTAKPRRSKRQSLKRWKWTLEIFRSVELLSLFCVIGRHII